MADRLISIKEKGNIMALLNGYKQDNAVFVRFSGSKGKFIQTVPLDTPGAVVRKKKDSDDQVAELFYNGVAGRPNGITVRKDEKYGTTEINIAFKDPNPDEPTVVAKFNLVGELNGVSSVNRAVVAMLQAMNNADLREPLRLGVSFNDAGSKFKDKNGVEQVREHAQSTIFVAPVAAKKGEYIKVDFDAIPKVEEVKNASGKVIGKDTTPVENYAADLIVSLQEKMKAIREELKESDHSEQFGEGESATPAAAPAA